jgi:hypothetical protein
MRATALLPTTGRALPPFRATGVAVAIAETFLD